MKKNNNKNCAFVVPVYPPHYSFARCLLSSWKKNALDVQSDVWFVFTDNTERNDFGEWDNSIVLPKELVNFRKRGIINIKKFYALSYLKDWYDYIIVLDAESVFIKSADLKKICSSYFESKVLLGNVISRKSPKELQKMTERIKSSCKQFFGKTQWKKIDSPFYLWFNQPCIYKCSTLDDFFLKIHYEKNASTFTWYDFDYYIYMYYLILYQGFRIENMEIDSIVGVCESNIDLLDFRSEKYKQCRIFMCSKALVDKFDSPNLFIVCHFDRSRDVLTRPLSKDISVVVQGAINKEITPKCLASIRKYLPNAEIILSTWEGSHTDVLDADIIVKSKDPGVSSFNYHPGISFPVNTNRQLVSVQEGLKKCSRKYTLKFRTDFYLENANFLNFFDDYTKRNTEFSFFSRRVITCSLFARRFSEVTGFPTLYHPSDFFFFGFTEDIKDYFFETPLDEKNEYYHCEFPDRKIYPFLTAKFTPEQYYCVEWAKRHSNKIDFKDNSCWSREKLAISDEVLFNNFIFLNPRQIGIRAPKFDSIFLDFKENYCIISNDVFEREYQKRFTPPPVHIYSKGRRLALGRAKQERFYILKLILKPVRPFVRIFIKRPIEFFMQFLQWCG